MEQTTKLNKPLWTNITRLKLLTKKDAPVKFILEKSPFDDEDEEKTAIERDEYVIIGRIFPTSEIYKEGSFQIEMKVTSRYPAEPPVVRFITPIYHPNIENDGKSISNINESEFRKNVFISIQVHFVINYCLMLQGGRKEQL
jgi:ubiquitin-protein ligase